MLIAEALGLTLVEFMRRAEFRVAEQVGTDGDLSAAPQTPAPQEAGSSDAWIASLTPNGSLS